MPDSVKLHSTTILCVQRDGQTAMGGDGQVTLGDGIIKGTARKIRFLYDNRILAGFAGASADAFTLFERFEAKLEQFKGGLMRSAVELAKDWRTDRVLRRLEAMLTVADSSHALIISGTGDVIEPDDKIVAIGSGGNFARAAARALIENTELSAEDIVRRSLGIAADICIYTNNNIIVEKLNG